MTGCPFRLCSASVEMLAELKAPGSNEALRRVPQHQLGGHEELGLCPASLKAVPLSSYDAEQLEEQAQAIDRLLQARASRGGETPRATQQPSSAFAPRPDPNPQWFRPNPGGKGGGQTAGAAMEQVLLPRKPLRLVGPASTTPTKGNQMASVEGVNAMLIRAAQLSAEAADGLFVAEGLASQALQLLNVVRESSVDSLGAPQVTQAIEKIGEAGALLRKAIEINTTYQGLS